MQFLKKTIETKLNNSYRTFIKKKEIIKMQHNRTFSEMSDTFWPNCEQFTVRLFADL